MGTKYSTNTISGYNASPPADDGSTAASNQITWAKHKTKLGDPLKTLAEAINTDLVAALNQELVQKTNTYSITAAEHDKAVEFLVTSAGTDAILLDAATAAAGYLTTVINASGSSASITVKLATSTDLLNGTTNGTLTLPADSSLTFIVNANADGYSIHSSHAVAVSGNAVTTLHGAILGENALLYNASISASVSGNGLTVALKTRDGGDPAASDPAFIATRSATAANGDYTVHQITSALSLVVTSGSTLGTVDGIGSRIYVAIVDDGGSPVLGVWNPVSTVAFSAGSAYSLKALRDSDLYSSTAMDNGADSAHTLYTASAVTNRPVTVLGYVESTQASAGVWITTPSKVHLMKPNDKRTGDIIQSVFSYDATGDATTSASFTDVDGSSSQITPTNAINPVLVTYSAKLICVADATNTGGLNIKLVRDSTDLSQGGGGASGQGGSAGTENQSYAAIYLDQPATASAVTYKLQVQEYGNFNGSGTVSDIQSELREIMA